MCTQALREILLSISLHTFRSDNAHTGLASADSMSLAVHFRKNTLSCATFFFVCDPEILLFTKQTWVVLVFFWKSNAYVSGISCRMFSEMTPCFLLQVCVVLCATLVRLVLRFYGLCAEFMCTKLWKVCAQVWVACVQNSFAQNYWRFVPRFWWIVAKTTLLLCTERFKR